MFYAEFIPSDGKILFEEAGSQAEIDGMLFTKLGYFYDWANNGRDYGLTSFTVRTGAKVEVKDTLSIVEYREELARRDDNETW